MSRFATFEKLIVRKEAGYVCDETALVKLASLASFETCLFKLTTKIETCLLLLTSHTSVEMFTVDVVVLKNPTPGAKQGRGLAGRLNADDDEDSKMADAWEKCEAKGLHGLMALAHIDSSCLPNNGSRVRYTLAQFVDALVHGIEAYFMFQKFSPLFTLNAAGLWDTVGSVDMEDCYIVFGWMCKEQPRAESLASRLPLSQLNMTATSAQRIRERIREEMREVTSAATPALNLNKRPEPPSPEESQAAPPRKRGKPIKTPRAKVGKNRSSTEEEEDDEEVTFKNKPLSVKLPDVTYSPDIKTSKTPASAVPPSAAPVAPVPQPPPEPVEDMEITFGFESAPEPKTPGRKSTVGRKSMGGRKSMMPDWPEEEKDEVLEFFDSINPKQTEQARIALACKLASMKYDRELPSKLLYQWVQKKGRIVHTPAPGTSYDLPESQRKDAAVKIFRSLNPDHTEASRVAFTCKFFQTQYGVALQSKQLYDMLEDKGKKTKAGTRRR